MNKQKTLIVAGILILLMLIGLLLLVFITGQNNPNTGNNPTQTQQGSVTDTTDANTDPTVSGSDPTLPTTDTTAPTKSDNTDNTNDTNDTDDTQPDDLPPFVELPIEDEDEGLTFPCEIPGYDLVIEKLAPYTGLFVEDGSNTEKSDIAMLLIRNESDQPLEYSQISVKFGSETLEFNLSALPAKESAVVQERSGKSIPDSTVTAATALVVQRAEMSITPEVSITDNGDNSITVQNLTDKEISTLRIFYKYYMEEEGVYVGGIAFTVKLNRLPANGTMVIHPSHYLSQTSRIVMAQTYDTNQ